MVRIDVETIVWSRAPRNMASMSPLMIRRICWCEYSPAAGRGSRTMVGSGSAALFIETQSRPPVLTHRQQPRRVHQAAVGDRDRAAVDVLQQADSEQRGEHRGAAVGQQRQRYAG